MLCCTFVVKRRRRILIPFRKCGAWEIELILPREHTAEAKEEVEKEEAD